MYLVKEMPERAKYEIVVNYIRWALNERGMSAQAWADTQEDKIISGKHLYNILNEEKTGNYQLVEEIAYRLGIEIIIVPPSPLSEKKD